MSDKPRAQFMSDGVAIGDGLQNVVANLGTRRDKASHTNYYPDVLDSSTLINAYRTSWLASAAVDYPVEDATRKWRSWRADAEQISAIEALEERLRVRTKIKAALITARLVGGAALYINTGAADPAKPLTPGEEIKSLVVLSKDRLKSVEIVKDINNEYFGKTEYFTLFNDSKADARQIEIHASRFVLFTGVEVPAAHHMGFDGINGVWGDSVLQKTLSAVKSADSAVANIASMLYEANVDVMKVQGFANLLEQGEDNLILKRARLQAAMKGINGMLMIDAEDDYQKKSSSFGGLDALLAKFFEWVAGALGIPVTRLFGRAAAGLSGEGNGDERVYYDRVEDVQKDDIAPAIAVLDEVLITQALGGRPAEIHYEWNPMRQKTEAENADIFTKYAAAARSLAGTTAGEIIPMDALSDAMVNALTEAGVLPGLEGYVQEYGTMGEQTGFTGGEDGNESNNFGDAAPMPLYVSRKVTNASEIIKHYADQGVGNLVDAADMHVTITLSRTPVDWMKMGDVWDSEANVPAGGARVMEGFGEDGRTLVLSFVSSGLTYRHEYMVEAGASWDWPDYQPHATVSYDFDGDVSEITPWRGEIKLGPEVFEEVVENWSGGEDE